MDSLTHKEKLRLTIHHEARSVCTEKEKLLGISFKSEALELIGEVAWTATQNFARDLEHFARHAKRSLVNSSDVKLLVRKNPALVRVVEEMINTNATTKAAAKK